jgi:hypothetical protein
MCGSRMGFDLFTKYGRANFWLTLKNRNYKRDWWLIAKDTFGQFVCKVIGHKPFVAGNCGSLIWGCNRCGKFIDPPVGTR